MKYDMAKCPACKKEICVLFYEWTERVWGKYSINDWNQKGEETIGPEEYLCPECDAVVATNHRQADKILGK